MFPVQAFKQEFTTANGDKNTMEFKSLNLYPVRTTEEGGIRFELRGATTDSPERDVTAQDCTVTPASFKSYTGYDTDDLFGPYDTTTKLSNLKLNNRETVFVLSYKHHYYEPYEDRLPEESELARVSHNDAQSFLDAAHDAARRAHITRFWIWTDRCVAKKKQKQASTTRPWIALGLLPYMHAPVLGFDMDKSGERFWLMMERVMGSHANGYITIRRLTDNAGKDFSTVLTYYAGGNVGVLQVACRICVGMLDGTEVTYASDRKDVIAWALEQSRDLSVMQIITMAGTVRSKYGGMAVWSSKACEQHWNPAGRTLSAQRPDEAQKVNGHGVTVLFAMPKSGFQEAVVKLEDGKDAVAYFVALFDTRGSQDVSTFKITRCKRLFMTVGPMVSKSKVNVMEVIMKWFLRRGDCWHPHPIYVQQRW